MKLIKTLIKKKVLNLARVQRESSCYVIPVQLLNMVADDPWGSTWNLQYIWQISIYYRDYICNMKYIFEGIVYAMGHTQILKTLCHNFPCIQ